MVQTFKHAAKGKQTLLCERSSKTPIKKKKKVESGPKCQEKREWALQPRALIFGFEFTFNVAGVNSL